MKIKKLSKFRMLVNGLHDVTVHICTMGNNIIYLCTMPDTKIITQLTPGYYGILQANTLPHVWHDKSKWLESEQTQANIHTTHGLQSWKIYTIKQSLFDYFKDRPK